MGAVGSYIVSTSDKSDLSSLLSASQDAEERALAARYAPILRFDAREPFLPLAAGYTVFRQGGPSPSFSRGRRVELAPEGQPPASLAIEYAIWWDWDIGHLYELEHVWVFVDAAGQVVRGEASWHGDYRDAGCNGALTLESDHLVVYSEPGKHAFAPTPAWFVERQRRFKRSETGALAGVGGVLLAPYIADAVQVTPLKNRLVHTYLARHAFEPSWDFSQVFRFVPEMLIPWPVLRGWMGARINSCLDQLLREIPPADYRFLRIAHRGATLRAIRRAAELGADAVEFDVRWTADDQAVLAHDPYLFDAGGRAWPVRCSTLDELQAINPGEGERVPTFAEAVEVCKEGQLGAYVEIKDGAAIPAVIEMLREQKFAGHSIVGAFRPDWLMAVKATAPQMATSIMFSSPDLDAVLLARSVRADFVHPCWERLPHPSALLTPEWVARVREAELGIICWHEERPEEIAVLRRAGVDGICSDAPELLDSPVSTPK
jgi:glycerophosphoryl diester phosphodiesterase